MRKNDFTLFILTVFLLVLNTPAFGCKSNSMVSNCRWNDAFQLQVKSSFTSLIVSCSAPDSIRVSNLQSDNATLSWTDAANSSWEYYTQALGGGLPPVGSGLLTSNKTVTVTRTNNLGGTNLLPDTWYEFFVRSNCSAKDKSNWIGPFTFKTACDPIALPFWEGFNSNSNTINCWTNIQNNFDSTSPTSNMWHIVNVGQYEGDQSIFFNGLTSTTKFNEWWISPQFNLISTKFYRLKYHYATSFNNLTDFKVMLSNSGVAVTDFKTTLIDKKGLSNSNWAEDKLFITGVSGRVNLAWNLLTDKSTTDFSLDNVYFEEVLTCPEPLSLGSKDEKGTSATIFWADLYGSSWEYVVQNTRGKVPTKQGVATNKLENTVTQDYLGNALVANTEYEFYVRTKCKNGDFSIWSGPYKFKTACGALKTPFWEGFNSNSNTVRCWTVVDQDLNYSTPQESTTWNLVSYGQHEGSHVMNYTFYDFTGTSESNDWLISPNLEFKNNVVYRLKYHFNVDSPYDTNEFEVVASNSGINPINFKKEIFKSQQYQHDTGYIQNKAFIANFSGEVNIAWHVKGIGSKSIYIDNVSVEEVVGCPEPLDLRVSNIERNKATLSWTDDFKANKWEYYVQNKGAGIPKLTGTNTVVKDNIVTTDQAGKNLAANTEYEFYVRTVCGNGAYSIWEGPFTFITSCDRYNAPFFEGFNTHSESLRCWSVIDANQDGDAYGYNSWTLDSYLFYEGNQAMGITAYDWSGGLVNDDWLVSPNLELENSEYVLKYHYLPSEYDGSEFEVLLSYNGIATTDFTKIIVPLKGYQNKAWKEEVVFFSGQKGIANMAWHMTAKGSSKLTIDKLILKKIETCPEPYYVKVNSQTTNSINIEWKQEAGVKTWEVKVVKKGENEQAAPITTVTVNGNPTTTIQGLNAGTAYTIYVRAICNTANTTSDWSTPIDVGTTIGLNDACSGAVNIPINKNSRCEKKVSATFVNSTISTLPEPTCDDMSTRRKDIWFEFTATETEHVLTIGDYFSLSDQNLPDLLFSIYTQDCSRMTNSAFTCFNISSFTPKYHVITNLIVGSKYYIRIATNVDSTDFYFSLCLSSPAIEVIPSGQKYTVDELVKDVLVSSECDLISNISYRTGTSYGSEPNGIGYFESNNTDFSFENGIVLATNGVETSKGPSDQNQSNGTKRWLGDVDLENVLLANGQNDGNFNASVIEFDFIPVTDTIKFDFIFASNEYGSYQCNFSDVFAFLLTDLETDTTQNLAVVPETAIPISTTTIHNSMYFEGSNNCGDANEVYFDAFYGGKGLPIQDNPINYSGMTVPMTATSAVQPGKKYHIKLAIADYKDERLNSAVFLKGGSFNLGKIDLGKDLLIDSDNALCANEAKVIHSGLTSDSSIVTIQWFKDDVVLQNENKPSLTVDSSGIYKVIGLYKEVSCEVSGSIKVEIYPPIHSIVNAPSTIEICRFMLNKQTIDLTISEKDMFKKNNREEYQLTYYSDIALTQKIETPQSHLLNRINQTHKIYVDIKDLKTGCSEVFNFELRAQQGDMPTPPKDAIVCEQYILPQLANNGAYFSEPGGQGKAFFAGDILNAGIYTLYVLQQNGGECYEETSFNVRVTDKKIAKVFEDQTLSCKLYQLEALDEYSQYFTEVNGVRIPVFAGSIIYQTNTKVYVVATSTDGVCSDESSFTVRYEECPIPKGISPNGDGLNDHFDLSQHGVSSIKIFNRNGTEVYSFTGNYTNQWDGKGKNNKYLPDGTYYYIIQSFAKTRTGWVELVK